MFAKETTLINQSGLHARPASDFVAKAKGFLSKVFVCNLTEDSEEINAKSIVSILAEGMGVGTRISICADGPDEREAVGALVALVESGFGEE